MARRRSTPCRQKGKKAPPWKFFFCPHSSIVRFGRQVSKAVVAHQLREGGEIGNLNQSLGLAWAPFLPHPLLSALANAALRGMFWSDHDNSFASNGRARSRYQDAKQTMEPKSPQCETGQAEMNAVPVRPHRQRSR